MAVKAKNSIPKLEQVKDSLPKERVSIKELKKQKVKDSWSTLAYITN